MASPAVAHAQVNGAIGRPESPLPIASKRKRDSSADGESVVNNTRVGSKPAFNGVHNMLSTESRIRDLFDALQSIDASARVFLKRPLPQCTSDAERQAKRSRIEENGMSFSIEDKVNQKAYNVLDELILDINEAVKAQLSELDSATNDADSRLAEETRAKAIKFKTKAHELFRREVTYPFQPEIKPESTSGDPGGVALMTYGMAPTLKPVFTSLQRAATPDGVVKRLIDTPLPHAISAARVARTVAGLMEKGTHCPNLGELFPSPRNLPPLQPPKATKNTTKSNVLTFYHPEPVEKARYRSGSYCSANLHTGTWLDYSNATPTTHAKTKQRERAQSLAGVKPSSVELEMSEMEALFRGAFSSFAPSKDDAGAVIPSGQVSRIWWQRIGRRNFDKLIEWETSETEAEKPEKPDVDLDVNIDEDAIKDAIENWDDSLIDPSLDHVLGNRSAGEKEVDDLLEEVTDLIETLASHQRNRNLTLPTSQDRYSTDPVNGDMLRHGSLSHQPGEEEMATYHALKAQLSMIIAMLPPYAVARLNSDKLAELNVSTKIEVRTDEYKGVMEEDEPARLVRQAQLAAHTANVRAPPRTSSATSAGQSYATPTHAYGNSYASGLRSAAPLQQFTPHTPIRPQVPNTYGPRPPSSVPIPQAHPAQARPPPHAYRPPNGYSAYATQHVKQQAPYGTAPMPYPNSPGQSRAVPQQSFQNTAPVGSPVVRYPAGYQGYAQQQHQQMHAQRSPHTQQAQPAHQQHHQPPHQQHSHSQFVQHPHQGHQQQHAPPQPNYMQFTGSQIARTMSPQVQPANTFSPSPTPSQQHLSRQPYGGSPVQSMAIPAQHHYSGAPAAMTQGPTPGPARSAGPLGYHTHLNETQQRQMMDQANARARAQQAESSHMNKVAQGEVAGLAGIGLGGNADVHKMAAAKAMMMGNTMSSSPHMHMQAAHAGVNGVRMGPPTSSSPVPLPSNSMSPVSGFAFKPPS